VFAVLSRRDWEIETRAQRAGSPHRLLPKT